MLLTTPPLILPIPEAHEAGVPETAFTRSSSLVTPRRAAKDAAEAAAAAAAAADAAAATAASVAKQKGGTNHAVVSDAESLLMSDTSTMDFTSVSGESRETSKDMSRSETSGDPNSNVGSTVGNQPYILSTTPQARSGRASSPWEQSPGVPSLVTLNARQSFAKTGRDDSGLSEMSGGTDMDDSGTRPTYIPTTALPSDCTRISRRGRVRKQQHASTHSSFHRTPHT